MFSFGGEEDYLYLVKILKEYNKMAKRIFGERSLNNKYLVLALLFFGGTAAYYYFKKDGVGEF